MPLKTFTDQQSLALEREKYGLTAVVFHHVKKANDAAARVKINMAAGNEALVAYDTGIMIAATEAVYKLLADDNNVLPDNPKSAKSKK